jgi:hypothetical protein
MIAYKLKMMGKTTLDACVLKSQKVPDYQGADANKKLQWDQVIFNQCSLQVSAYMQRLTDCAKQNNVDVCIQQIAVNPEKN